MNTLTAYRSFGDAGYSPARGKVRIYNNRWYLCTFQKIDYDIGGGMSLGAGEYTELLPGSAARTARDSRLNRLNSVKEHRGEVWRVIGATWLHRTSYHPSQQAAAAQVEQLMAKDRESLAEVRASTAKAVAKSDDELAEWALCNPPVSPAQYRAGRLESLARSEVFYSQRPTIIRV